MQCPKCQFENPSEALFCMKCGTKLERKCPNCGAEYPEEAAFCMKCGTKLDVRAASQEPPVDEAVPKLEDMHAQLQNLIPDAITQRYLADEQQDTGENRLITALFADISGFTELSAAQSSEAIFQLVQDCFKQLVSVVASYEGSISGFRGDGLLALFGAPVLHENDAERAILAAIDMRNTMQEQQLNVSIGVNTALMTVGEIQTQLHREYTAYGTDINLAKRFQEAAKPGQVFVGKGTYRFTHRAFEFESLPPLTLKGIAEPVSAYAVLKLLPKPEKVRGIEGLRAELIGRDEEFAKLKEAFDEVLRGRGQMVSLIGEAGVGKSRLVSELKAYLKRQEEGKEEGREERKDGGMEEQKSEFRVLNSEFLWLEGRCLSLGMTASYWPFIDIFEFFAWGSYEGDRARGERIVACLQELVTQGALSEDRFEEMGPLLGHLLSIQFGNEWDERLKHASPEQIKHQTFMAIRDFFLALAKQQPVVLVFEDLHWADSLSLDLISLLMETLTLAPLFLLCVYRPEREHKCWHLSTIASQKCAERYTELHLRVLTSQQSRRLVESLLRIENLPASVKEMILDKSQGNPFFVEEVVRSLIDSEMVYQEEGTWRAQEGIESITVPESIQSVIMSRLDRLEDELKHVLQRASIIGRLFRRRLLSQVTQQETELEQYLWELEDHQLIYQERTIPEEEYSFRHVLMQETVYQNILERRRATFHQQVAEAMEMLYQGGLDEYYEQLAYHYDKSGNVEKAVEYMLKAGEKSRLAYLNDEAIGYFHRALERIDASPSGEARKDGQLEALKGLGQIYHGIGKISEAEECLRQAIALGREMELPSRELVRLYFWLGDVMFWQGRYDEKIRIGEEGLALLGDDVESVEAALMNDQIAVGHFMKKGGDKEKSRECRYRNAQFLQRLPYSEELRPAYEHVAMVYLDDKNVEEGLRWIQASERVAEQHHDLRGLGMAYFNMGRYILVSRGDLRGTILQYQRALELFTKIGDDKHRSWCLGYMGSAFLSLGDCQKAEDYAYREIKIQELVGEKWGRARSYQTIGVISLCQDSLEKATNAFQKAEQLYREIGWDGAPLALGIVYLVQDKRQEALQQFQEAMPSAYALSGLEEAYHDPEEFRDFCRRFREEHPEVSDSPFSQWYLEPAEPLWATTEECTYVDTFAESLASDWDWQDPFDDCSFKAQNGLEIHAANGRNLWYVNLSAPRILRKVAGDFAAQTVCVSIIVGSGLNPEPTPAIGGILLWKDKENFLRLDKGTRGEYEISFMGCVGNEEVIIGRGRLPSERVFLRLERHGNRVNALCSSDGKEWFTVGHVEFPIDDPVEVGLHAIGDIDRTIYRVQEHSPTAYPDGTAIRFETFQLFASR